MIAKQQPHYQPDQLRELLDERLSLSEANRVEDHLSDCGQCRVRLQEIAGESQWWDETADVLSQSMFVESSDSDTDRSRNPSVESPRSLDASLDWVRPLLKPARAATTNARSIGRVDQYDVQSVIGQGGMGVVLRGIDPELNRPVAIKVLSPHLAGVGAARTRFMREAQSAAVIVHPSVVPIYSVVPTARLPYLVMPCISGGNLQQRIDRDGPLPLEEILRVGWQVAEGLAAAHRNHVIHRDIKPANILIEEGNGRVLISDFGLARVLDDATLTNSGMIAGTPQYMSPEQARGEPVDVRSDLFSMGSLLYALATGRAPFRAETTLGVLRKIMETRAKPITEINERLPAWFDTLVSRLMEPDLARRIASADDAATLLREAHAHVINPSTMGLPRSLERPRPRREPFGAIAALALLLVVFVALRQTTAAKTDRLPETPSVAKPQPRSASSDDAMLTLGDRQTQEWRTLHFDTELQAIWRSLDHLSQQLGSPLPGESK